MASIPVNVEVQVNHVQHTVGAIETPDFLSQGVEHGRLERLIELIDGACAEAGFSRQSTELLQSINFKRGHMPELHLVLVQLPDYLSDQLRAVVKARVEQGGR